MEALVSRVHREWTILQMPNLYRLVVKPMGGSCLPSRTGAHSAAAA